MATSCQKDTGEKELDKRKSAMNADSAISDVGAPDNFLADSGKVTFKLQDSTYTFDATTDSVAFVNMVINKERYFGITAINKAHTLSFGISSKGSAASRVKKNVAGAQLLFKPDELHAEQFTLTPYAEADDAGKIKLSVYRQKKVLAKGTFSTYFSKNGKENSTLYPVEGSFELLIK
ncbi:hypothetical protein FFF34_009395 [Inquilinus sp. KBS0705]|nr:hypothetical protein FFF34_009395 [Inquilinus sp. KBS0705]